MKSPNDRNILAGMPKLPRKAAHALDADDGGATNRNNVGCNSLGRCQ